MSILKQYGVSIAYRLPNLEVKAHLDLIEAFRAQDASDTAVALLHAAYTEPRVEIDVLDVVTWEIESDTLIQLILPSRTLGT